MENISIELSSVLKSHSNKAKGAVYCHGIDI